MPEELLIDVNEFETRIALVRDHVLQEVHLDRSGTYSLTGNIYRGKVERILPGMQAAFVDIGLPRPGFLHAREIHSQRVAPNQDGSAEPDIRELLHAGQSLLVQVAKDPISSKGARLTTNLAIAGRYMVLLPLGGHIGISQRIDDEAERERLRQVAQTASAELGLDAGSIVRTAAEGTTQEKIFTDLEMLMRIWSRIREQDSRGDRLVYEELPMHIRVIRDLASTALEAVRVNDVRTFERIDAYMRSYLPEFPDRLLLVDDEDPQLFERHGVEDELQRSLGKNVELKSGGGLIIEQTEAMITIDVNSGAFLGTKNLEETAFRTNLEAASAIPRQLRLRNLGGLIVIDFIDMCDADHQRKVLRALEKAAALDPGRIRMTGFSTLGLVEMSRKRTRKSVAQQMCEPCPACTGSGLVKTAQTTCYEVFRSIKRDARLRFDAAERGEYTVRAHESVIDRLLDEHAAHLQSLVAEIGRAVRLQVEPSCGAGEFDVVFVPVSR